MTLPVFLMEVQLINNDVDVERERRVLAVRVNIPAGSLGVQPKSKWRSLEHTALRCTRMRNGRAVRSAHSARFSTITHSGHC